jgi:hypothetical protein
MLKALKRLANQLIERIGWFVDCCPMPGIVEPWASGFAAVAI